VPILGIVERVRTERDSPEEVEKWNQLSSCAKQFEGTSQAGGTGSGFIPTEKKVQRGKVAVLS